MLARCISGSGRRGFLRYNVSYPLNRAFHQTPAQWKAISFLLADIGEGITEVEVIQWYEMGAVSPRPASDLSTLELGLSNRETKLNSFKKSAKSSRTRPPLKLRRGSMERSRASSILLETLPKLGLR